MQCCQVCVMNQPGMTAVPVLPGLPNPLHNLQQIMQQVQLKKGLAAGPVQTPGHVMPSCPACGANPVMIEASGRFGCPQCYEAFKEDIEGMVMRHHGAVRHVGKVPKAWKARQEAEGAANHKSEVDRAVATVKRHKVIPLEDRIKLLELKMASVVKSEEYERAALIRDVIRQMKASVPPASSEPEQSPSEIPLAA